MVDTPGPHPDDAHHAPLFSMLAPGDRLAALSHGGLADADPWAEAAAPRGGPAAFWPFRLDAAAETLEVIALALAMFIAVRFVAQNYVVDGSSMVPTFHNGDLVVVNKIAYRAFDLSWLPWSSDERWRPFGPPRRGDVVVFEFPLDPTRDFIKRVIGLPGDTVEVHGTVVYVNGMPLDEPYLPDTSKYDFLPQTVPAGKLFVLGDNRNNSYDSHAWGMLDQSLVIGRAELRYWPFSQVGRVQHHRYDGVPAAPTQPQAAQRRGPEVAPSP